MGAGTRGKLYLSSPRERKDTGDLCQVPQQRYVTGKPGKLQGRDRVGILEESCGYRARGVSIRGKFVLLRNLERGGRHMAKRSSDPRVVYPEVKLQVRDPVRDVGIVAPFAPLGGRYQGKICFIEPQEETGHRRPVPGAPSSGTSRESQANFRTQPCGDCRRVLWVPGPWGQYSGKIRFIETPGVQKRGSPYGLT